MRAVSGATQRKVLKASTRPGCSMWVGFPAAEKVGRFSVLGVVVGIPSDCPVLDSRSAILQHRCCLHDFFGLLLSAQQFGKDCSKLITGKPPQQLAAVGDADVAGLLRDDQYDGIRFLAHADGGAMAAA